MGTTCSASTITLPARRLNIVHLLGHSAFRDASPRRDLSALRGSGRDLQPGLPGLAGALPVRPGANHQDQRAWRDQHARTGEAGEGQDLPGLDQRGLWRPRRPPADRGLPGQRQPDRAARLLRRRQALCRNAVLRLPSPAQAEASGLPASSTPTARACIRTMAAWCRTSSSRR